MSEQFREFPEMRSPAPDPMPPRWIFVPAAVLGLLSPFLLGPSPDSGVGALVAALVGFGVGMMPTFLIWHSFHFIRGLFRGSSQRDREE